MSSEIIQEGRIHSGGRVNNEWDSCESDEDRRDLASSSPKPGELVQPCKAKTKALSSWDWRPHVLQRGWVGAVRPRGCSSPGAGRYRPTAGCCSDSILRTNIVLSLVLLQHPSSPSKCLVYLASFHLSASSSPRTR